MFRKEKILEIIENLGYGDNDNNIILNNREELLTIKK